MRGSHRCWNAGFPALLIAGLLSLLLSFPSGAQTPQDLPPATSTAAEMPQGALEVLHPLTLQECQQIALAQQPTIQAARASLAAARDRACAVANIRAPQCLAPDLPVRRQQSAIGVQGAEGAVVRAEAETAYAVAYCYLTILYTRDQERVAEAAESNLQRMRKLALSMRQNRQRRKEVWKEHVNLIDGYIETLRGRRQAAIFGRQRAMAALREAMGLPPGCALPLAADAMPVPEAAPCLSDLIALAEARRGEVVQTQSAVMATQLEIAAQCAQGRKKTVRTFAAGSDIHASPVTTGTQSGYNYEPAAIPPEMPTYLYGSSCDRQTQAADYARRAGIAATKTQGLIALEAEDAFYRWQENVQRAAELKKATFNALKFAQALQEGFVREEPFAYPSLDMLLQGGFTETTLEVDWVDSHYRSLISLAALVRITAGGFCVDFDSPPRLQLPPRQSPPGQQSKGEAAPAAQPASIKP